LSEFIFGGEVRPMPNPATVSDEAWADYVFNRAGEPGVRSEWWYHIASGTWFVADRDNLKDEFIRTYLYGESGTGSKGSPPEADVAMSSARRRQIADGSRTA
jgi:sarcosine oxidase subunit delta